MQQYTEHRFAIIQTTNNYGTCQGYDIQQVKELQYVEFLEVKT